MKTRWIAIGLMIVFLAGIGSFARILVAREQRNRIQETVNKGSYLTSLVALQPIADLNQKRKSFFLRTLTEYVSPEGLVYCFVHDREGNPLLSLAPQGLSGKIPREIEMKSRHASELTKQDFAITDTKDLYYEFAKPVFEGGQRTGVVRLGLRVPPLSLFSSERISLMAVLAFFILAAGTFVYYGVARALLPIRNVSCELQKTRGGDQRLPDSVKNGGIGAIIENLEQSFDQIKEKLTQTEMQNLEMATKVGVLTFEKNLIARTIDSLGFGIIITDIQDNINHANAYLLNLVKKERREVLDRPLADILGNEEILAFISRQESLENNTSTAHLETTFQEFSQEETFRVSASYLRDVEGAVIGKMILIKNITSEKSAEKNQHGFIANVAHEFLTPLTTIKSYNEMLMEEEIEDKEMQREFYNTISEETSRLSRLIQNLLNLSKIEMGSLSLNSGLVKTDWLVEDSMATIESPAKKKEIVLEKHLPDNFPSLLGDKELLKTALINILGNAVKYSPKGTTINFDLHEDDETVTFEVKDQGHGIPKEDLPHIFDKFYRSKDPIIAEQTGSGLGLAMTAVIIHLHGGEIEVESEPGEGSHFTIRIPKEEYHLGKQ
jgi:signal transduction histidine kinase